MRKSYFESQSPPLVYILHLYGGGFSHLAHKRRRRSSISEHRHIPADDFTAGALIRGVLKSLVLIGILSSSIYGLFYLPTYFMQTTALVDDHELSVKNTVRDTSQDNRLSHVDLSDSHVIDDSSQYSDSSQYVDSSQNTGKKSIRWHRRTNACGRVNYCRWHKLSAS